MDDPQCTKGGHRLCLLVICILAFIIPAHNHGAAAAGATTLSIEGIQDLRKTVDELKAFSKAEKKVNDGIHHSLAVNAETVSRLEESMQVLKDKATLSVDGITDLCTTVDKMKAFSKAEKEVNDGIHRSIALNTETISRLEETMQVLKDKATLSVDGITDLHTTVDKLTALSIAQKEMNDGIHSSVALIAGTIPRLDETLQVLKDNAERQLEQKQFALESRIQLEAEKAHFDAVFDETQVNPGLIKFMPSAHITTFGSKDLRKDEEESELSTNCRSSKWKEDASTGRCYYIVPEYLTWSDANKRCQMEGGQLLSIGSPEEQDFINGMVENLNYYSAWLGGRRIQGQPPSGTDGTGWEWFDGSPFKFMNWYPNEPNNDGGYEDCLGIKICGRWNDMPCEVKLKSICERPGIIADGVFTAPISGVYKLSFTAWKPAIESTSIVDIHNNNRIIASASSNAVGMFGIYIIKELKAGDQVAVFLSQGAIGGQSERSTKFSGKLVQGS